MKDDSTITKLFSLQDAQEYLLNHNWTKKELSNKAWLFLSPSDNKGNKLEVILPSSTEFIDYERRIYDMLRLVSFVEKKEISQIAREISLTNNDVFKTRKLKVTTSGTIPLMVAATDVGALKDLFTYTACSEEDSRPYFDKPTAIANHYMQNCEFGHTFQGSFGFTIVAPVNSEEDNLFMGKECKPFERRVMERLVRSFELIERSIAEENPSVIIQSYDTGLNDRMCEALLRITGEEGDPVEFAVEWSPKIPVPQSITKSRWRLDKSAHEILEVAAEELKKVAEDNVIIVGKIVTLHSTRNIATDSEFSGNITVKHIYDGHNIDVRLDLDREQ